MATLCFTGRRPKDLFGYNDRSKYCPIVDKLAEICEHYITDYGVTTFISGGAQGIDQMAFWAVNRCKRNHPDIRNIVYRPFPGQECRWKESGLFSQNEYNLMLQHADEVITVRNLSDTNDFQAVRTTLMDRNAAMIDNSDYVLAVAPYAPGATQPPKGGTCNAFLYARKHGKHLEWLDPFTLTSHTVQ